MCIGHVHGGQGGRARAAAIPEIFENLIAAHRGLLPRMSEVDGGARRAGHGAVNTPCSAAGAGGERQARQRHPPAAAPPQQRTCSGSTPGRHVAFGCDGWTGTTERLNAPGAQPADVRRTPTRTSQCRRGHAVTRRSASDPEVSETENVAGAVTRPASPGGMTCCAHACRGPPESKTRRPTPARNHAGRAFGRQHGRLCRLPSATQRQPPSPAALEPHAEGHMKLTKSDKAINDARYLELLSRFGGTQVQQ